MVDPIRELFGVSALELVAGVALALFSVACSKQAALPAGLAGASRNDKATMLATKTPIKHVVVVFGENISFDHYFGTYPGAENQPSEPAFFAASETPVVNNLLTPLDPSNDFAPLAGVDLLRENPNFTAAENGVDAANPFAWVRSKRPRKTWITCTPLSSKPRTAERWICFPRTSAMRDHLRTPRTREHGAWSWRTSTGTPSTRCGPMRKISP